MAWLTAAACLGAQVCVAEQNKLFATHKAAVEAEQLKLQKMDDLAKLCPDLGMRRGGR